MFVLFRKYLIGTYCKLTRFFLFFCFGLETKSDFGTAGGNFRSKYARLKNFRITEHQYDS